MKKKLFLLLVVLPLAIWGIYEAYDYISQKIERDRHDAWVATLPPSASANVQFLEDTVLVDYLDEKRSLAIYLPADYDSTLNDYSVVYFLDGQSLFDQKVAGGTEWFVDEVLDSLGELRQEQSIIVGIYSSEEDRMTEYKPMASDRIYSDKVVSGDKHADWIVRHVKPWVDKRFRTKRGPASTAIGGASLGGLMSYWMLHEYPEVFGRAIVFSPSFWVHESVYGLHKKNKQLNNQKIYFNAGQLETPTVESIEKMQDILLKDGMPAENIKLDVEAELGHWHMTWQKGFPKAYPWVMQ